MTPAESRWCEQLRPHETDGNGVGDEMLTVTISNIILRVCRSCLLLWW